MRAIYLVRVVNNCNFVSSLCTDNVVDDLLHDVCVVEASRLGRYGNTSVSCVWVYPPKSLSLGNESITRVNCKRKVSKLEKKSININLIQKQPSVFVQLHRRRITAIQRNSTLKRYENLPSTTEIFAPFLSIQLKLKQAKQFPSPKEKYSHLLCRSQRAAQVSTVNALPKILFKSSVLLQEVLSMTTTNPNSKQNLQFQTEKDLRLSTLLRSDCRLRSGTTSHFWCAKQPWFEKV